jgi:hypothetical protein
MEAKVISQKTRVSDVGANVQPGTEYSSLEAQKAILPTVERPLVMKDIPLADADRMLVLVSRQNISDADFARRIWTMAAPAHMTVVYLCVVNSIEEQMQAERRLATLAAITRDAQVRVEFCVIQGGSWLEAVRKLWKPRDVVVCHAEPAGKKGWSERQPLDQVISTTLKTSVIVLSGFAEESKPDWKHRFLLIPYWLSLIAILAGSFLFQAKIYQADKGFVGTVMVLLTFIVEVSIIWFWNSIQI